MASTVLHVAVAALVGTALLADEFDARAIGAVLLAAALVDADSFLDLIDPGLHRAVGHSVFVPLGLGLLLVWDTRWREESWLRARWADRGVTIAWVALGAGVVAGGILPDLFFNGVNLFWPVHDQFYTLNGKLLVSSERGLVQTFVEFGTDSEVRTSENTYYRTPVHPTADPPADGPVERIFPIARSGLELLTIILGYTTVALRLWVDRR